MKRTKFLNCRIDFSRHNFLPRAETEFWVGKAMRKLNAGACALRKNRNLRSVIMVLDIFAGTGCIGIAVLKNIKNCQVDFSDISKNAAEQIKINLKLNKISKNRYKVYSSNLFEKLKGKRLALSRAEGYDFIFANPPYVALDRISEVQKEVLKNEPHVALFAGKDGMVMIAKFFKQVKRYLKPGGKIFLEFDPLQKEKIAEILKKEELKVEFKKDQFGKYRWLVASFFIF
ncbi:MAG: HemK/PrmC family methyltransferase [Patescibacteria group bacterium]